MPQQPLARPEAEIPPARPVWADDPPRFLLLEREVEIADTVRRCWPRCKAKWTPPPGLCAVVKFSIFGMPWNTPGDLPSCAKGKARPKPTVGCMRSPRICGPERYKKSSPD